MKIFLPLVFFISIISYQAAANGIKLSVIRCEYEQTSSNDSENQTARDTITYVGVFSSIKD